MIKYKQQRGDGTMFGKNLKYYRLKNNMSMKELADLIHISPMAISYYEKEERKPDMQTIKELAKALHIKVTDFLANRDASLKFCHGEFRKNSRMSAKQQEFVKEEVEERTIEEKMDVVQGKVVIGCDILFNEEDLKDKNLKYQAMMYNNLLRRKCKFKIIPKCKRKSKFSIYCKFKLCSL